MPNNITLFKRYTNLLDEVYQNASVTSMLDMNGAMVRMGTNANEIVIPKISMDGLGDYTRNGGYAQGSVTLTNETVKFNYDRVRRLTVDAMDDEETAGVAFGSLSSEFIRTKAAPEQDAFRFATYASVSGISAATPASLTDAVAVLAALIASQNKMDEDEVPTTERYLFITPTLYKVARTLSVSVLPATDPGELMQPDDYLLVGDRPELTEEYTLRHLRRDWPGLAQVQAIADNRGEPYHRHRRVEHV